MEERDALQIQVNNMEKEMMLAGHLESEHQAGPHVRVALRYCFLLFEFSSTFLVKAGPFSCSQTNADRAWRENRGESQVVPNVLGFAGAMSGSELAALTTMQLGQTR